MKLSERILAAWAEKEWPGQQMEGWAHEVAQLEVDNEKRMLYGAELAQERNDLRKIKKRVQELIDDYSVVDERLIELVPRQEESER